MKRSKILFSLLMAVVMMAMSPQKVWALGGSGTSSDPYTIASASDLVTFASKVNGSEQGAYAKLTADITLTSAWTAMGTSSKPYNGTFDGQGHTISGLNLTATAANAGLFGYVNGATIKNFSLAGSISSNSDNVGSVVGYAKGSSTIQDIVSTVNITMTAAKSHLGGIAGNIENGSSVLGCTYSGTLNAGSSSDSNGGIVGFANANCSGTIQYCFFNGTVKSTGSGPQMGGILGYTNDESNNFGGVQNCYSCGTLTYTGSDAHVNAIVGRIRAHATTTINNTYLSGIATRACNTDGPSIPASNKAITISVTAGANGTVSQSYVNPTSTTATQLQVVATPSEHYHFGSWSDSGAETHNVGLTANVSLTASFAIDQHTITVKANNDNYGTVTGGGTYDWNSKQTIKATAKAHYHFVEWNDGNTDATRTITVTGDKTYTATFAIDQHTITVNVANGQTSMGTVSGGGTFDYNSTKTISATPKEHYHFVQWNDGNTSASRTITVTENKTYTATFAINQYTITVETDYDITGTVNTTGGTYDYGTELTISATPKTGYHFYMWSDYNTDATRTIIVTGDATYTAKFGSHYFGEWITDTEATCFSEGTKHRVCNHAGCNERENGTIEMVDHTCSDFDANGFGECSVCHAEQYERPERDGDIWQIRNAGQLYYYADIVNKYHLASDIFAELRNDIVVNDGTFDADGNFTPAGSSTTSIPRSWTPIGGMGNLRGVRFEGYGHTISGLYFNDGNTSVVGFVGNAEGYVHNLGIINCYIKGNLTVGGIGTATGSSVGLNITNCYVTGRISGNKNVGGISGAVGKNSKVSKCWSDCIVTAADLCCGGISGSTIEGGEIEDCYSMGTVIGSSTTSVGGITGWNRHVKVNGIDSYGTVRNCYSTATVSGGTAGSICGLNDADCTITSCYSTSTLPAIAENNGTALYCESNVSAERLASGEITYKLNGSVDGEGNWTAGPTNGTQTWYQLLGTDPAPGYEDIGNNKVYYGYDDCRLTSPRYTNLRTSDSPDKAHKYTLEHLIPAQDEDGLYNYTCIYGCGTIVPDKYILLYDQNLSETEMIRLSVDAEGKYYSDFDIFISDGRSFHSPVEFYSRGHIFMRPDVPYIDNETPTPATTMLPFSIDIDKINAERNVMESLKFYSFANLEQNLETGKWVANMYRVYDRLEAYTPYMILIYPETYYNYQGDQYSPAIFPVTPDPEALKVTEESGDWSFVGTNERKEWTAEDFGNGQAYYGFAAGNAETPTGKFVKVGQGAWIPPLRAYIKKNVQAGGASNAPTRAGAVELPSIISVHLNETNSTGIGTLNTETGEFTFDGWYDLQGRRINEPAKNGISIHNNKKVLVK